MFRSSFFRRDVQPPQQSHTLSPVSIIERPNSSEITPDDEPTKETPVLCSQIQIPEHSSDHSSHPEGDEKREKARKAAKYLKLIIHCQVCGCFNHFNLFFSSLSICTLQRCNGKCNTLICKKTRLLLNHCAPCQNRDKCPIKGCFQTKKLLCHMIACRYERKQALQAGTELKECSICSGVDSNSDDAPQDNHSPDNGGRDSAIDMDGFTRPMLPRRFRSNTQDNIDAPLAGQVVAGVSTYNCRSFSVEEESEEMDEDGCCDAGMFRSRRVSI